MNINDVVIMGGARTGMAEYCGLFSKLSAIDLGVTAAEGAYEKSGIKADEIETVVIGNAMQTSSDAIYGARHVALRSGVGQPVPAVTVNRLCGSGIEAIILGAQEILLGQAQRALVGGIENMTQAPFVVRGVREKGMKLGHGQFEDLLMASLLDPVCGLYMAQTAEKLAQEMNISRQAQDEFALVSHQRGSAAVKEGRFHDEIVPITVKKRGKKIEFKTDDHIKPETTLEGLSQLPAAFGKEGTVTAGNASGIVDGAACLVLSTIQDVEAKGLTPLGRIVGYTRLGVDPSIMGIGPAPAIRQVLEKTGLSLNDIDLFEINEAFAAQYLGVEKDLGLDREKVNVNGGAIAIGHPLAATGTRLVLTALHELKRRGQKKAVCSACIGGGQGIAIVVEAMS